MKSIKMRPQLYCILAWHLILVACMRDTITKNESAGPESPIVSLALVQKSTSLPLPLSPSLQNEIYEYTVAADTGTLLLYLQLLPEYTKFEIVFENLPIPITLDEFGRECYRLSFKSPIQANLRLYNKMEKTPHLYSICIINNNSRPKLKSLYLVSLRYYKWLSTDRLDPAEEINPDSLRYIFYLPSNKFNNLVVESDSKSTVVAVSYNGLPIFRKPNDLAKEYFFVAPIDSTLQGEFRIVLTDTLTNISQIYFAKTMMKPVGKALEWEIAPEWEVFDLPELAFDLRIVNDTFAYCNGKNGISVTNDGGESWESIGKKSKWAKFLNSKIGYIEDNGVLTRTEDGGLNWISMPSVVWENEDFKYILSDKIFYAAVYHTEPDSSGNYEFLFKSINGGITWDTIPLPSENRLYLVSLIFVNPDIGFCLTFEGDLLRTSNGGKDWIRLEVEENGRAKLIDFTSEKNLYAFFRDTSYNLKLYRSTDLGNVWTSLPIYEGISIDYDVTPLVYFSSDSAFGLTGDKSGGIILKTSDGGKNWVRDSFIPNSYSLSIFETSNRIFVSDRDKFLLRRNKFLSTKE
jgi:photosystem II stability/assembly factor-like uncharacterized protein